MVSYIRKEFRATAEMRKRPPLLAEAMVDESIDVPLAPGAEQRPFARLAPGSSLPVGLLVSRDGRSVFVAATMADRVVQFDVATLEPLRHVEIGGEPDGLASTLALPRATCHACAPSQPDN